MPVTSSGNQWESKKKESISVFLGYDREHELLGNAIKNQATDPHFTIKTKNLELCASNEIIEKIEQCDIFVLIYSSSTKKEQQGTVPDFISPLKPTMTQYWKKSVLFKNYGEYFTEAFAEYPDNIEKRNNRLIKILGNADKITFEDVWGNRLLGALDKNHIWTSVSGKGNIDIVPGEIASHVKNLNGEIVFCGTFLSTIPFATKYGVSQKLATLKIQDSRLIDFTSENVSFSQDFRLYLNNNEGNTVVEEYGIGTNNGVRKLYGRNAGFEERHPGLHLGLGGGKKGSHHLDLIFSAGKIFADDQLIFDNGYDDSRLAQLSGIR